MMVARASFDGELKISGSGFSQGSSFALRRQAYVGRTLSRSAFSFNSDRWPEQYNNSSIYMERERGRSRAANPSGEPATQSERPEAVLPANDHDKTDQQQQQQQHQQEPPPRSPPQGQQSEEERLLVPGSRSSLCRICRASSWTKEPLISPCRCKGTQAHVHLSCLERWLNQSCRNYCELCNFRYNALETPRYGWFESLRIWVNHPRNRQHIRTDFLIFALLTVFTAGLSSVCLLGTHHYVLEGVRVGFSEIWTRGAIAVIMTVVILGYSASAYLLIRATPWYRWWRSTVNVRLLLEPELRLHDEANAADDEHRR